MSHIGKFILLFVFFSSFSLFAQQNSENELAIIQKKRLECPKTGYGNEVA